jgi:hypothetical protein
MTRSNLLLATIVCAFVAGCATPITQLAADPDDKTVVTGSRLPAKDRDSSSSSVRSDMPAKGGAL